MKILVLSDSHSSLSFMRYCIAILKPEHIVHLGDHFDDAQVLAQEYPNIKFHQVPGNCDLYRCNPWQAEILCYEIGGVKLYMTHGHRHGVKSGIEFLVSAARESGAQAVLFGHSHQKLCLQQPDGLWILNPGSCGSWGGSVGIVEIKNEKISACYLMEQTDLEAIQGQSKTEQLLRR